MKNKKLISVLATLSMLPTVGAFAETEEAVSIADMQANQNAVIIDDSMAAINAEHNANGHNGGWTYSAAGNKIGTAYRYWYNGGDIKAVYPVTESGVYDVYVNIPYAVSTKYEYTISDVNGKHSIVFDTTDKTAGFYKLGEYTFDGNIGSITLSAAAGDVRADAVAIVKKSDADTAYISDKRIDGNAVTVNFGTAQADLNPVLKDEDGTAAAIATALSEDGKTLTVTSDDMQQGKIYTLDLGKDFVGADKWTVYKKSENDSEFIIWNDKKDGDSWVKNDKNQGKFEIEENPVTTWNASGLKGFDDWNSISGNPIYTVPLKYTPSITKSGTYKVSMYNFLESHDNGTLSGKLAVNTASGLVSNEYEDHYTNKYANGKYQKGWSKLGTYSLDAGAYVRLSGMSRASAVKFETVDSVKPQISSISATETSVRVSFNKAVDAATVNENTVAVYSGDNKLDGKVSVSDDSKTAIIEFTQSSVDNGEYSISVDGVKDMSADENTVSEEKQFISNAKDVVITDDGDAVISGGSFGNGDGGTYNISTAGGSNVDGNHLYWSRSTDIKLTYTPNLSGGIYNIYVYVPYVGASYGSGAVYDVYAADGVHSVEFNQSNNKTSAGYYKLDGEFKFEQGTNGKVVLHSSNSDMIRADALKFEKIDEINSASIDKKVLSSNDNITVKFTKQQNALPKITVYDTESGEEEEANFELSADGLSAVMNETLTSGYYVVKLNGNEFTGTSEWTVYVKNAQDKELVIWNNKNDGTVNSKNNGTYETSGSGWSASGVAGYDGWTGALGGEGSKAVYTPNIEQSGAYKVSLYKFYTNTDGSANYGPVGFSTTVNSADGENKVDRVLYAMQSKNGKYIKDWTQLGVYNFDKGTSGKITMDGISGKTMRLSAVKLEYIADAENPNAAAGNVTESTVEVKFNKAMDISSLNSNTITLKSSTGDLISSVVENKNDAKTVVLHFDNSAMYSGETYTVCVNGARDASIGGYELNSNIDFVYEVNEEETKAKAVVTTNVSNEKKNVNAVITISGKDSEESYYGAVAAYNSDGSLEKVIYRNIESNNISLDLTDISTASAIKVFAWTGSMKPILNEEDIEGL